MRRKNKKSELPDISVIIPSFNKVKYIGETLTSLIAQDYPHLEVIIQDPGSTDGSLKIIGSYVKKYPGIFKLYKEKDGGQLDAINKGFEKANGDVLAYINADDTYELGALRKVGGYFLGHPDSLWLAGRGKVINKKGDEVAKAIAIYKNILLKINSYKLLLVTNYLIQPSVFLTRKAWSKYGPFQGKTKFVMEYEMWLRMGKKCMPAIIDDNLSSFRMSGENISAVQYEQTLSEDENIVLRHTKNKLVLGLHRLNNLGRLCVVKFLQ